MEYNSLYNNTTLKGFKIFLKQNRNLVCYLSGNVQGNKSSAFYASAILHFAGG